MTYKFFGHLVFITNINNSALCLQPRVKASPFFKKYLREEWVPNMICLQNTDTNIKVFNWYLIMRDDRLSLRIIGMFLLVLGSRHDARLSYIFKPAFKLQLQNTTQLWNVWQVLEK